MGGFRARIRKFGHALSTGGLSMVVPESQVGHTPLILGEPMPHCDADVIHAPGVCQMCDQHPRLQEDRRMAGIPYTGQGLDPATERRSLEQIERWPRNRAVPYGEEPWTP
jgi:hypothetical protein